MTLNSQPIIEAGTGPAASQQERGQAWHIAHKSKQQGLAVAVAQSTWATKSLSRSYLARVFSQDEGTF
jgi:hypothetical protein